MKQLTKVTAIFDRSVTLLAVIAAVLIIFILLATLAEVGSRYFLGYSIVGMVEITEFTLLFITFLGTTWLLKEEGHVKMDLVLARLKPRTQAVVNIITSIIGVIICLVVFWYGARLSWDYFQRGFFRAGLLELPEVFIVAIIPIGSFLLSIQFLRRTYGFLGKWRASPDKEQNL